jgi:hypothetical protein
LAETALAQLQAEVRDSEQAVMRAEVASKHRLPPVLGRRLVGTTRAEIEADAAELEAALRPGGLAPAPKEALLPGAVPSARAEPSAADVVDKVLAR